MSGEVFHFHIDESVSSEFGIVATEYVLVFSCRGQNAVSVEGFERVEVEYEKQIVAQECEYLVSVVFTEFDDRGSFEFFLLAYDVNHGFVEGSEVLIFQIVSVYEVPLPTSVFIGPAVSLTRKIDPFGVAEFISHKVEVAAVDGREGYQPYHFMQGHASIYDQIGVSLAHVPIHDIVDEPEDNGFVADQCLVVALGIIDGLFIGTPIGQFPKYGRGFPVLVFFLLMVFIQKSGIPIAIR